MSVEEIVNYLNPLLPFDVWPRKLEFIRRGQVDESSYWLWAFYGDDGHRWNLIIFSGPKTGIWMCADNNPYELSDRDYIAAIYNREY